VPALYQIHPVIVHFTVALLVISGLFKWAAVIRQHAGFEAMSFWLLRLGMGVTVLAVGFGLLAERTAPLVPAAWETLANHKQLGLITAGTCLALWALEEFRQSHPKPWLNYLALVLWLGIIGLVLITGNEGGQLVFLHGVGVAAAPHL
jgi:uncharacterized membrane protein